MPENRLPISKHLFQNRQRHSRFFKNPIRHALRGLLLRPVRLQAVQAVRIRQVHHPAVRAARIRRALRAVVAQAVAVEAVAVVEVQAEEDNL